MPKVLPRALETTAPKRCCRFSWLIAFAGIVFLCGQAMLLKLFKPLDLTTYGNIGRPISREIEKKPHSNKDRFLSSFVANFIQSHSRDANQSIPIPFRQQICETDKIDHVLDEWKENYRQLTCETRLVDNTTTNEGRERSTRGSVEEIIVDEYALPRWENQPTIVRYKNVEAWSMRGPIRTNCSPIDEQSKASARALDEEKSDTTQDDVIGNQIYVNATVIRVALFDVWNPYESFHAYTNVAMVMIMFDLHDPQLVLISNEKSDRDMEIWRLFSKLEPIFVSDSVETMQDHVHFSESAPAGTEEIPKPRYRFREIIDAPPSHLSMINTKSGMLDVVRNKTTVGALRGRSVDHECQSLLFQAIIEWIKWRANPMHHVKGAVELIGSEDPDRSIQILWSSRQPYCCRNNSTVTPKRILGNEEEWITRMSTLLGERYNVTIFDFGKSSLSESIQAAQQSDILVGVHGAGLMWSVFLPMPCGKSADPKCTRSDGSTSGLVEIFGGDRSPHNRHYHNIASLMGIQYRETGFWNSPAKMIAWNPQRLNEVASHIRSINISSGSEKH